MHATARYILQALSCLRVGDTMADQEGEGRGCRCAHPVSRTVSISASTSIRRSTANQSMMDRFRPARATPADSRVQQHKHHHSSGPPRNFHTRVYRFDTPWHEVPKSTPNVPIHYNDQHRERSTSIFRTSRQPVARAQAERSSSRCRGCALLAAPPRNAHRQQESSRWEPRGVVDKEDMHGDGAQARRAGVVSAAPEDALTA